MPPERDRLITHATELLRKVTSGELRSFPTESELAQQFGYQPSSVGKVLRSAGITKEAVSSEHRKAMLNPSLDLAWMLGVISGNAFMGKGYETRIRLQRSNNPDLLREFQNVGKKLFGKDPKVTPTKVTFFDKSMISELGDLTNNSWPQTISEKHDWILKNSIYTWKFIEGLFDARGNLSIKPGGNALYFVFNNQSSSSFLGDLLLRIGVQHPTVSVQTIKQTTLYKIGVYNISDLKLIAGNIHSKNPDNQNKLHAIRKLPEQSTVRERDVKKSFCYLIRKLPIPVLTDSNTEDVNFSERLIANGFIDKGVTWFEALKNMYRNSNRLEDFDSLPPEIKLRLEAFTKAIMQEVQGQGLDLRTKFFELGTQVDKDWFLNRNSIANREQKFIADKLRVRKKPLTLQPRLSNPYYSGSLMQDRRYDDVG